MSYKHAWSLVAILSLAAAGPLQAQGRGRGQEGGGPPGQQKQVSPEEQHKRVQEEQGRQQDYRNKLDAQIRAAQAEQSRLESEHHAAQLEQHQAYVAGLQRQRQELEQQRDIEHEPYITAAPTFRYRYNGVVRETNEYGAQLLRNAVNAGYEQGYAQGRDDRRDRLSSNYRRAFAYQDANYGYSGRYVAQDDYNYYFRQGFRDGYTDGYANGHRYGTINGSSAAILASVAAGILAFSAIHQ